MKKGILILLLALSGKGQLLFGQETFMIVQPYGNQTESIFRGPDRTQFHIVFDFDLSSRNKMTLFLRNIHQLDSIPPLDSLIGGIIRHLEEIRDTIINPLSNYRIDYVVTRTDRKVRIREFPQAGNIYSVRDEEIVQLKVEQDTLNIQLFTMGISYYPYDKRPTAIPYHMTFLLNNFSDLKHIDRAQLSAVLLQLKTDLAAEKNKRKGSVTRYYAHYDVETAKKIIPKYGTITGYSRKSLIILPPFVEAGIQYLRGSWVPTVGAGFTLRRRLQMNSIKNYRFLWEPHFFFSRNDKNELDMDRNDFITFKYHIFSRVKIGLKEVEFNQTVSLGYLVHREGDWFERHTIKFSIPGVQMKNVLLEPEFYFNDLFKNFSPSLKLSLHLQ